MTREEVDKAIRQSLMCVAEVHTSQFVAVWPKSVSVVRGKEFVAAYTLTGKEIAVPISRISVAKGD